MARLRDTRKGKGQDRRNTTAYKRMIDEDVVHCLVAEESASHADQPREPTEAEEHLTAKLKEHGFDTSTISRERHSDELYNLVLEELEERNYDNVRFLLPGIESDSTGPFPAVQRKGEKETDMDVVHKLLAGSVMWCGQYPVYLQLVHCTRTIPRTIYEKEANSVAGFVSEAAEACRHGYSHYALNHLIESGVARLSTETYKPTTPVKLGSCISIRPQLLLRWAGQKYQGLKQRIRSFLGGFRHPCVSCGCDPRTGETEVDPDGNPPSERRSGIRPADPQTARQTLEVVPIPGEWKARKDHAFVSDRAERLYYTKPKYLYCNFDYNHQSHSDLQENVIENRKKDLIGYMAFYSQHAFFTADEYRRIDDHQGRFEPTSY